MGKLEEKTENHMFNIVAVGMAASCVLTGPVQFFLKYNKYNDII